MSYFNKVTKPAEWHQSGIRPPRKDKHARRQQHRHLSRGSHLSGVDEAGGDEDCDDDAEDGQQDEHADLERLQAVAGVVRVPLGAD